MENNIIQTAYNHTNELLTKHHTKVTTTTGKEIMLRYEIEEIDNFVIHSITCPLMVLEQEIYTELDENGNIIEQQGSFNKGMVHSFIIGVIRNY